MSESEITVLRYRENAECDRCDEIKDCVHINILKTVTITICKDCLKKLADGFES